MAQSMHRQKSVFAAINLSVTHPDQRGTVFNLGHILALVYELLIFSWNYLQEDNTKSWWKKLLFYLAQYKCTKIGVKFKHKLSISIEAFVLEAVW